MIMMPRKRKRIHKHVKDQYEDGVENSMLYAEKQNSSSRYSKRTKDEPSSLVPQVQTTMDQAIRLDESKKEKKKQVSSEEVRKANCCNIEEGNDTDTRIVHETLNVFDEDRFFSTTATFPASVLEEARSQIYEGMEEPLRRLEHGGHEMFLDYLKQKSAMRCLNGRSQEGKETVRKSLHDAYISGDIRGYQRRLLEVALSKNIIINLATGTGKTLIALLCIKEKKNFSNQSENSTNKKQTLFLVPSVALAIQQSITLRSNLPGFRVETACYSTSSSRKSRKALASCDIIVATHGAIYDLMMHYGDSFSMDRFSLVVIDECHYASGNHPYTLLMKNFYHTLAPEIRPHILGLTASPLVNVKETSSDEQLMLMLDNLEQTLDATLISARGLVSDETHELLSKTIEERAIEFKSTNTGKCIPSVDNLQLLPSRMREFKQLEYLYKDLGPLVLSVYCNVLKRELSPNVYECESKSQIEQTFDHLNRIIEFCDQEVNTLRKTNGRTDKLLALEEIIEEFIEKKGNKETIGLVFVERRITAMAMHCYFEWKREQNKKRGWLSAREARDHLADCEILRLSTPKENHQFVDSIDDPFWKFQACSDQAKKLGKCTDGANESTQTVSIPKISVKSVALARNPTQIFNSLNSARKIASEAGPIKQQDWIHRDLNIGDVLSSIRNGNTNVMFATTVIEEGVDVQACSLVVAFDGLNTIKGYIQMKGRARKENAMFFVLEDPFDDRRSKLRLSAAQAMDKRVQYIIERRTKTNFRSIPSPSLDVRNSQSVLVPSKELATIESGSYRVGDAVVDLQSSRSLLNRYFQSLPVDPFVRSKRESLMAFLPYFEENRLVLPLHLPPEIRNVCLPDKCMNLSRREKQRLLSLIAIVRLHTHSLLNDRLLPLAKEDILKMILQAQFLDKHIGKPTTRYFLGCDRHKFYVYPLIRHGPVLSQYESMLNGNGRTLGLFTIDTIGPMKVGTIQHKELGAITITLGKPIVVSCSESQFIILQQVFILLMNSAWGSPRKTSSYEICNFDHYESVIAPYVIGIISSSGDVDWIFMEKLIKDSVRPMEERNCSLFCSDDVAPMASPRIWRCKHQDYVVFGPTGTNANNEHLFQAHKIWSQVYSDPWRHQKIKQSHSPSIHEKESVNLLKSECFEAPLADAHTALLSLLLPQFLYFFEKKQNTLAMIRHCENTIPSLGKYLRAIDEDQVTTTITAKSCNQEDNYDLAEYVGDGALKVLLTDSLMKSSQYFLHEGDLSILRSEMSTNERLKEACFQFHLSNFVMTIPLSRGAWAPCVLHRRCSNELIDENKSRSKVYADVIESLLGLVYLEFGYDACQEVANDLGLLLRRKSSESLSPLVQKDDGIQRADLMRVIKECTGYEKFHRPILLAEALTHPSSFDAKVASYQRLEWVGDALLTLAVRERLIKDFADKGLTLGDLVNLESVAVCNQTLGFLSMKYGLQQFLDHGDPSLPKRIESYFLDVQNGSGVWGVDPPKPISDIVESIIGAVHIDGGFVAGLAAALNVISPVLRAFCRILGESGADVLCSVVKHPVKKLQELSGNLLNVDTCTELVFSLDGNFHGLILQKDRWRKSTNDESMYVSCVKMIGETVVAVADENPIISRTGVASLTIDAIDANLELKERIMNCQSRIERGISISI